MLSRISPVKHCGHTSQITIREQEFNSPEPVEVERNIYVHGEFMESRGFETPSFRSNGRTSLCYVTARV